MISAYSELGLLNDLINDNCQSLPAVGKVDINFCEMTWVDLLKNNVDFRHRAIENSSNFQVF